MSTRRSFYFRKVCPRIRYATINTEFMWLNSELAEEKEVGAGTGEGTKM